jgi:predicted HicB family RNase H-like nuclease
MEDTKTLTVSKSIHKKLKKEALEAGVTIQVFVERKLR